MPSSFLPVPTVIKLPGIDIGGRGLLTLPPATTEEPPPTLEVAILYESI